MHAQTKDFIPDRAIYVSSLSDYNAGRHVGAWIDVTNGPDAVYAEIESMLKSSREPVAEEWAIHDYQGFEGIRIGEYDPIEGICAISNMLDAVDNPEVFAAWYDAETRSDHDPDALIDAFHEEFQGVYRDLEAWAEDYVESTGMLHGVPDNITRYFDYAAFGRGYEYGGDIWTVNVPGGIAVFTN